MNQETNRREDDAGKERQNSVGIVAILLKPSVILGAMGFNSRMYPISNNINELEGIIIC